MSDEIDKCLACGLRLAACGQPSESWSESLMMLNCRHRCCPHPYLNVFWIDSAKSRLSYQCIWQSRTLIIDRNWFSCFKGKYKSVGTLGYTWCEAEDIKSWHQAPRNHLVFDSPPLANYICCSTIQHFSEKIQSVSKDTLLFFCKWGKVVSTLP